jgi:large subunit ribosomal protein L10
MYKTSLKHKLSREKKAEIISSLTEEIKNSYGIIFSHYQGLNNAQFTKLRRDLKKYNANFKVVKNTFLKLALKNNNLTELENYVNKAIGVVLCKEEKSLVELLKYLFEFSKENLHLELLCGRLFNTTADIKKLEEISKLPSKEELIAKLVGLLSMPIRRLYSVLNSPMVSLINILNAKSRG